MDPKCVTLKYFGDFLSKTRFEIQILEIDVGAERIICHLEHELNICVSFGRRRLSKVMLSSVSGNRLLFFKNSNEPLDATTLLF